MDFNAKMTAIANKIRELTGTTEPLTLNGMETSLIEVKEEVAIQNEIIEQIVSVMAPEGENDTNTNSQLSFNTGKLETVLNNLNNGGSSSGGNSSLSRVHLYLKDINLSEYYQYGDGIYENVDIVCAYINESYSMEKIVFGSENGTFDKSEVFFSVPTNSTIILNVPGNHYVDFVHSDCHNEIYDLQAYEKDPFNWDCERLQGFLQDRMGMTYIIIPIFGNTEIRITE